MIRVGVIGGIGSGKSFISKLFKSPVFNADKEVDLLYKNSLDCYKKLNKKLPKFIKTFPILKSQLINAINQDKKNIKRISSIVHPLVRKKMKLFLNRNKKSKIVILDIPLLVENKLYNKKDILIFVKCNQKKVIKRLKKRKNYNKKVLINLKKNQVDLLKKRKLANYIVDNNFSPIIMKKKINSLKNKILNERNSPRY
jgi:dephospho-CoA kinase